MTLPYLRAEDLLELLPANQSEIARLLHDHGARFRQAPGSRGAHHAWGGGYWDHLTETLNIAVVLYAALAAQRPVPFLVSDAVLVLFLHDLEKPFKYGPLEGYEPLETKRDRALFRLDLMARYNIQLTEPQHIALRYVEGEGDDYREGERTMNALAAFCHMCDVWSARGWPDYPKRASSWSP